MGIVHKRQGKWKVGEMGNHPPIIILIVIIYTLLPVQYRTTQDWYKTATDTIIHDPGTLSKSKQKKKRKSVLD